jgi:hypothetical protein
MLESSPQGQEGQFQQSAQGLNRKVTTRRQPLKVWLRKRAQDPHRFGTHRYWQLKSFFVDRCVFDGVQTAQVVGSEILAPQNC